MDTHQVILGKAYIRAFKRANLWS